MAKFLEDSVPDSKNKADQRTTEGSHLEMRDKVDVIYLTSKRLLI